MSQHELEVREQLVDVDSLLPPCGFWGLNIGHQACQLVSLPTGSCHCPPPYILNLNVYLFFEDVFYVLLLVCPCVGMCM